MLKQSDSVVEATTSERSRRVDGTVPNSNFVIAGVPILALVII